LIRPEITDEINPAAQPDKNDSIRFQFQAVSFKWQAEIQTGATSLSSGSSSRQRSIANAQLADYLPPRHAA
jgi:hypothetical protein